jgi:hypothetical protein
MQVPTAAFDPVFWLHHANMDRLLWLWQQRFPDIWVAVSQRRLPACLPASGVGLLQAPCCPPGDRWLVHGSRHTAEQQRAPQTAPERRCHTVRLQEQWEGSGNYYNDGGQHGGYSELTPFWKDASSFWTGDDLRDIARLHYFYAPSQAPQTQALLAGRRLQQAYGAPAPAGYGSQQLKQGYRKGIARKETWGEAVETYKENYDGYRWQVGVASSGSLQQQPGGGGGGSMRPGSGGRGSSCLPQTAA